MTSEQADALLKLVERGVTALETIATRLNGDNLLQVAAYVTVEDIEQPAIDSLVMVHS